MTTADKLLTQIKEDREIRAKATQGEWLHETYGDAYDRVVTRVHDGKTGYGDDTILDMDGDKPEVKFNAEFCAHAANTWERKNRQLEIAVEGIQARLALGCECGNEYLNGVKTSYKCYLHQTLEDMGAVK